MKLLRYGSKGQERPGLLDQQGNIRDLSAHLADLDGGALSPAGLQALAALDPQRLPVVEGSPRLGAPVAGVGKFIAIGLNFSDHARESNMAIPAEPPLFSKATSCIVGPHDEVIIPRGATKVDWEVELGIVIGSHTKYVTEAQALHHVAGYCTVNDVSERDFQKERQGQWTKGKSHDTFGPIGPWMVTRDEVPDPQALKLWCDVDGKRFQDGSTKTMVYGVRHVVSYLSQFMSLQPGDIIATGTPPGVGMGVKPVPKYLRPGDRVRLGVEGLGEQDHKMVAA